MYNCMSGQYEERYLNCLLLNQDTEMEVAFYVHDLELRLG